MSPSSELSWMPLCCCCCCHTTLILMLCSCGFAMLRRLPPFALVVVLCGDTAADAFDCCCCGCRCRTRILTPINSGEFIDHPHTRRRLPLLHVDLGTRTQDVCAPVRCCAVQCSAVLCVCLLRGGQESEECVSAECAVTFTAFRFDRLSRLIV